MFIEWIPIRRKADGRKPDETPRISTSNALKQVRMYGLKKEYIGFIPKVSNGEVILKFLNGKSEASFYPVEDIILFSPNYRTEHTDLVLKQKFSKFLIKNGFVQNSEYKLFNTKMKDILTLSNEVYNRKAEQQEVKDETT